MRGGLLIAVLCLLQAVSLAAIDSARAGARGIPWERATPSTPAASEPEAEATEPPSADSPATETRPVEAAPSSSGASGSETTAVEAPDTKSPPTDGAPAAAAPSAPPHPVVAIIREKLADPGLEKDADESDLAALRAFYGKWPAPPLWITEMGFSAKGQAALFEIENAYTWGLDAEAFDLPDPNALPKDDEAEALAEIKLDLAILKYARLARGGRHEPLEISELFDQTPPLLDPNMVIAAIGTRDDPAAYLQSLHPRHEQFARLRQALLEARDEKEEDGKTDVYNTDTKRIIINMERWRWMPEDLGELYVWLNTPEFMLYLVKDGETIFEDKTLVGTIGYPTPVFSDEMETVVFNPDWVAPPSVLTDKLLPALQRKYYGILKSNKLRVSYQGRPVDPRKVDWNRVNILNFTFTQRSGPKNVLGKAKFLYPNKHIVYMHDTLPYRRKIFKEEKRAIGYGCVRMENPRRFAELLLTEDEEWPAGEVKDKVKELWEEGVDKAVTIDLKPPVHTTYFTAVVNDEGKVETFGDFYGLDRAHAIALFGEAEGFPKPPPERKQRRTVASTRRGQSGPDNRFADSVGFLD